MRVRPVALTLLLLAGPGAAGAVTQSDLTLTLESVPDGEVFIGIDDCQDALDRQWRLTGTLTAPAQQVRYDLLLVWSVDEASCTIDNAEKCPSSPGNCGCLAGVETQSHIEETFRLTEIDPNLCAASDDQTEIEFRLVYDQDQSNNDTNNNTQPIDSRQRVRFIVDLLAPPAPTSAPTLRSADAALVVKVERVDHADVDRYEVCWRPVVAGGDDGDDEQGERACQTFGTGAITSGGVRVGGLENDVNYLVSYATVDQAGNRSAPSPTAQAVPQEVRDFAEMYSDWRGGETGGCNAAGGGAAVPVALLGLGGLVGLARLRRRSR